MKYLVVTVKDEVTGLKEMRDALEASMVGVKVAVIGGATAAVVVETDETVEAWNARQPDATAAVAELVAQKFHETYERLAPELGYETRTASAKPWADVPDDNKILMIATVADLIRRGIIISGYKNASPKWSAEPGPRCPTCDSPAPPLHPATQNEGEVTHLCADPFHAAGHKHEADYESSTVKGCPGVPHRGHTNSLKPCPLETAARILDTWCSCRGIDDLHKVYSFGCVAGGNPVP